MSAHVMSTTRNPTIFISEEDFDRLDRLAASGQSAHLPVADFLAAELDRAVVRRADEIAPDIVTMNARITFRIGDEPEAQTRTLVYPEDYSVGGSDADCLSVMTPLGAALIGLRAGDHIGYETVDGTRRRVTVEAVVRPSRR